MPASQTAEKTNQAAIASQIVASPRESRIPKMTMRVSEASMPAMRPRQMSLRAATKKSATAPQKYPTVIAGWSETAPSTEAPAIVANATRG